MRFVLVLALWALVTAPAALAADPAPVPGPQQISAMAARAAHAKPKDRSYLYAKLVRAVGRVVGRDVSKGNTADTASSLRAIRSYTGAIERNMSEKSKRLRQAQVMLRHTAFLLKELMMNASLGQQSDFRNTLAEVDHTQSRMMLTVFQK